MPAAPAERTTDRRTRVKSNIYYRVDASGQRVYEISWREAGGRAGKRRWQKVDGGLREAEAALTAVKAKLARGEKGAPSPESFEAVARTWLDLQTNVRPKTLSAYRWAIDQHLIPYFGSRPINRIDEDRIAALFAKMQRDGYKGWTIRAVMTPLRGIFALAKRRGLVEANPMHSLTRSERPVIDEREVSILTKDEISRLLAAAGDGRRGESAATVVRERALLATLIYGGLRHAEVLGLIWANVDTKGCTIQVRKQLDRDSGERVEPKTRKAIRDVAIMPALARLLDAHRLASLFSRDDDLVFPNAIGEGCCQTVTRRILRAAVERADLSMGDRPPLVVHDLRHCFASILISGGHNVQYVADQLGHADSSITLRRYSKLFQQVEHARRARERMEEEFAGTLEGPEQAGGDVLPLQVAR
jgi:integrase